jgi:endonuclease/exonuclease/phosphatase family metal-dependent hydrolase
MAIIDGILRLITYLLLFALAGSYAAPHVNPNTLVLPSLLGLAYHYLVISLLLLLLYWTVRRAKIAFVILTFLLAGYPLATRQYGLNAKGEKGDERDTEILTYNVHHLIPRVPSGRQEIETYIRHFPGDIVCLQDFPRRQDPARLFPAYTYRHAREDLVILSRRPIIRRGAIDFDAGGTATCIYADLILRGGDTARVYCLHLESFRFDGQDRRLFRDLPGLQREELSRGVRSIIAHIIAANKRRARQAATVERHVSASSHRVILCGDFNDTPISYTYSLLTRQLQDTFIEKGCGGGDTYTGEFPSFRIDYILHDDSLQAIDYTRDTLTFSDHYPVRGKLRPL